MPESTSRTERNLSGLWHSMFQTNSEGIDQWYPEELTISTPGGGQFQSTSTGDLTKTFHWTATGGVLDDEFVSGTWKSNKPDRRSAGTFILNIDQNGDKLLGFLLGTSEKRRAVNYGAWVVARDKAALEAAKGELADLCPGLMEIVFHVKGTSLSDILHPDIFKKVWKPLEQKNFDQAVREAFIRVEEKVRDSAFPGRKDLFGTTLMKEAFGASGPFTEPFPRGQALREIFTGATVLFRNPAAHGSLGLDLVSAIEQVMIASHLCRIVDGKSTPPGRALP